MTALPTTAKFMDYEAVYLLKNRFFKDETMNTLDYLALFFPFEKPEVAKRGIEFSEHRFNNGCCDPHTIIAIVPAS